MTVHAAPLNEKGRNPILVGIRRRKGWTYRQLGEALGMSYSHLQLVETGRKPVSPRLIEALLKRKLITIGKAQEMVQFYIKRKIFCTVKGGR